MDEQVSTEVEPVVDTKLREALYRLSMDSLKQFLGNFGHTADDTVSKNDLIDAILKLNEAAIAEADKTNEESLKSVGDEDPMVEMVFENLESPGTSLEFTFSKDGFKKDERGRVKPLPHWHFYPGRRYTVPLSVVEYLNSLRVPADKQVNVTEDGLVQSLYTNEKQNRFSCRIEFSEAQRKLLKG